MLGILCGFSGHCLTLDLQILVTVSLMFVLLAVTTSGVDAWRFSDLVNGALCAKEASPQKLLRSCVDNWVWPMLRVPVFSVHMHGTTGVAADRSGWMMSPAKATRPLSITARTVNGESTHAHTMPAVCFWRVSVSCTYAMHAVTT